jgi:hypothetical protein
MDGAVKSMDSSTEIWDTNDAKYIANASATPAIILHRLSLHNDVRVRMAVADNKNTHRVTAQQLARDDSPELRYALAENYQLDSSILNILTTDKNPLVADRAKKTLLLRKQAVNNDTCQSYRFNSPGAFGS